MGIKFNLFDFITGMMKIGITAILSAEAAIEPSFATFIGNSAIEFLGSLNFEKKTTIKARIEQLPLEIMPVVSQFTMPDQCREDLAQRLFTLESLKKCVESENIVEAFKLMIVDICAECPDCDLNTLQANEIANAISAKVMSLFLEDKALSDIVNLFIDRATYEGILESNRKLDLILELLTSLTTTGVRINPTSPSSPPQVSWITTLPYIPTPRQHIVRDENEEETVHKILNSNKVAISGTVGGIGKTELLRLVCKNVLDECTYHYVGWICYSGSIRADMLNAIDPKFLNNSDPIKSLLTLDHLYGQDMILFVDNVDSSKYDDDLDILRRLNCKVIVTTRNRYFFDFDMIYLDLLTKDVAVNVYLMYSNQSKLEMDPYVEKIVDLCGRHPLTIELVAKYAKKRKIANKAVYSELLEHGYSLDGLVDSNWNGNKNELIVSQLSKLYELSNISLTKQTVYILKCFSILPSYPLTKTFTDGIMDGKNADYASFDALVDNGWISSSQFGWYMHDVVKSVIKREFQISINDCSGFLLNLCMNATKQVDYTVMINSLTLLLSVADFFADGVPNNLLIRIYNNIGYVYQEITDYQNANKWFRKALDAINNIEDNEELIFIKALLFNNMGQYSYHGITQRLYRDEKITEREILDAISWYDKSLECYEILLAGHEYSWLDIEMRKLVAEHNKAFCLYYGGSQKEAISLINEIIYKKIRLVNRVTAILSHYYKRLLNSNRYRAIPEIIGGYKSLESLISILQNSYLPFDTEMDISHNIVKDCPISVALENLNDYRFALDNELIPSFIRSCDLYADLQCDYVMELRDADELISCIFTAKKAADLALDICEKIEKATLIEGGVWSTLSRVYFAMELKFSDVHAKEAAIDAQMTGIKLLECIFRESNDQQSKDPLIRAYRNMYTYTGANEWKEKAERLMSPVL